MKELTICSDAPGARLFLLGTEAIARGAIETGVQVAAAYLSRDPIKRNTGNPVHSL